VRLRLLKLDRPTRSDLRVLAGYCLASALYIAAVLYRSVGESHE
jgi:hypothetical protein